MRMCVFSLIFPQFSIIMIPLLSQSRNIALRETNIPPDPLIRQTKRLQGGLSLATQQQTTVQRETRSGGGVDLTLLR